MTSALVVMARYPEVGAVKTRLGQAIGAERACALYRAFLLDLEVRFAGGRRTLVWAFHPPESNFVSIVQPGARCLPQSGRDLAERMFNCFKTLFLEGLSRVIMIGADVPHVREEWLDEADAALERAEVVLGPSTDGGYYLVGMAGMHDVFSNVAMGTPDVLVETLRVARRSGLRVQLLPQSFDVDELDDLAQLQTFLNRTGTAVQLPHTSALLAEWATDRGGAAS